MNGETPVFAALTWMNRRIQVPRAKTGVNPRVTATERPTMSERTNRVRLSDQEKRVVELTAATVYEGEVPYGVVIERACRNLLAEEQDDDGPRHDRGKGVEL